MVCMCVCVYVCVCVCVVTLLTDRWLDTCPGPQAHVLLPRHAIQEIVFSSLSLGKGFVTMVPDCS